MSSSLKIEECRIGDTTFIRNKCRGVIAPKSLFHDSELGMLNPYFNGFGKQCNIVLPNLENSSVPMSKISVETFRNMKDCVVEFEDFCIEKNTEFQQTKYQTIPVRHISIQPKELFIENTLEEKEKRFVFSFEHEGMFRCSEYDTVFSQNNKLCNDFIQTTRDGSIKWTPEDIMSLEQQEKYCARELKPQKPVVLNKTNLYLIRQYFDIFNVQKGSLYINKSCGGHIHADVRKKTLREIKDILLRFLQVRDQLFKRFNKRGTSFCTKNSPCYDTLEQNIMKKTFCGFQGHTDLNLGAINEHKSIEFRLFDGFTSYEDLMEKLHCVYAIVNGGKHFERLVRHLSENRTYKPTKLDQTTQINIS
jgi:hypothetical protein